MPHCMNWARKLLREMPDDVTLLLEDSKYWDPTFLSIYLDHCDAVLFKDPAAGLKLASIAPDLAHLVPQRRGPNWRPPTREDKIRQRELTVRSYAVLGGALRAAARLDDAERAYRTALSHAASGTISSAAEGYLHKRLSALRVAQKRLGEALELIDDAISKLGEDELALADALTSKGYIFAESDRYAAAVPFYSQALTLAKPTKDPDSLASRTFHSAIHNLANALWRGPSLDDVEAALRYVKMGQRLLSNVRDSVNKYKLLWVEARILIKLGSTRTGERRLLKARKQLLRVGAVRESALVALELALLYYYDGRWAELKAIALEALERFSEISNHTEALAALRLLVDGAREQSLTREILRDARDKIEKRVAKAKPPGR